MQCCQVHRVTLKSRSCSFGEPQHDKDAQHLRRYSWVPKTLCIFSRGLFVLFLPPKCLVISDTVHLSTIMSTLDIVFWNGFFPMNNELNFYLYWTGRFETNSWKEGCYRLQFYVLWVEMGKIPRVRYRTPNKGFRYETGVKVNIYSGCASTAKHITFTLMVCWLGVTPEGTGRY